MREKDLISSLFNQAGITIDGPNPWDIVVHHPQFYSRLLQNSGLALGETYMDKYWDCQNLDQFFDKILRSDLEIASWHYFGFWQSILRQWLFDLKFKLFNYQSIKRAPEVGKRHYDIGNDLYQAMLDKRMVYTCANWDGCHTLDEAQEHKLDIACKKLNLKPGLKVLDVGCGWGSFAKFAVEKYDVHVVGITISKKQVSLGKELCAGLPVELRFQDYREIAKTKEKFDRIISMGMFEHVGPKNYKTYMECIAHCLQDDGLFLLQTIGANRERRNMSQWLAKYIFPNGYIPTISQIGKACEGIFVVEDWQNIGPHYDKTLMAWHANINQHWDELYEKYQERFQRMWNYYLLSCAGSFRARHNQLWQVILSKEGYRGSVFRYH